MPIGFASALVLAALLAPTASASHRTDDFLLGVYFDDPKVTLTPPTATVAKTKTLCTNANAAICRPGSPTFVNFGALGNNGIGPLYQVNSDLVATVWLAAVGQAVPIQSISVAVLDNGQAIGGGIKAATQGLLRDAAGGVITSLPTTPTKFVLSGAVSLTSVPVTAKLALQISVATLGAADNTNVDVVIYYGSAQYRSGVLLGVTANAGADRLGNDSFHLMLAENQLLTFDTPTATTALTRSITGGFPSSDPPEVTWGSGTSPKAYQLVSDGVFTATLQYATTPGAALYVGLLVKLYINGVPVAGASQWSGAALVVAENAAAAVGPLVKVTVGLPLAGTTIQAGDTLRIGLTIQAWSPVTADHLVLYGSTTNPSGILAAAITATGSGGGGNTGGNNTGNNTNGNNTNGNNTNGNNTNGNNTSGNNTTGNGTTGNNTNGNATAGNNTTGGNSTSGNQTGNNQSAGHAQSLAGLKEASEPADLPNVGFIAASMTALAGMLWRRRRA